MSLPLPHGAFHSLRLILGDQLNGQHSWYDKQDDGVLYLIAELPQEARYVKHHIQKLCAFFIAMQAFAEQLQQQGHQVLHLTLDHTAEYDSLDALISDICERTGISHFAYQRPDEYRLLVQLQDLLPGKDVTIEECDTEHFLLPFNDIDRHLSAQQHNRMESFYRKMRKRTGWLMQDNKPLGDKWNYDQQNRNKLKADDLDALPEPLCFSHATEQVKARIDTHRIAYFGTIGAQLIWPCTRAHAQQLLDFFCAHCLPCFGQFQDAMTGRSPHRWSLYHSRLSFALNTKLLSPHEVITQAIKTFEQQENISLAQIEGFVRQILGWREYVRAIYWLNMPHYSNCNALDAQRALPAFFWNGNTRMRCQQQAIQQSLDYAYAHHIQRLMVTGNFCLLAGIQPADVDAWYLGIYIDAIEWVELPNTRGMSQFADGGWIATKPYAASGNYINKMSDYCRDCEYEVKESTGDSSCPLNSLYWRFMIRHRERLEKNPRTGMLFGHWDKRDAQDKQAVLDRAEWCLNHLETL